MKVRLSGTITLLLLAVIPLLGCRPTLTKGADAQADNDQLSVNFISMGAGTDAKAEQKFSNYVRQFQNEKKVTLDYKVEHWGKEGETKYRFDLKKVPEKQKKEFKEGLNAMFKGNRLVEIQ